MKNRLQHAHHKYLKTPFRAIAGRKPNLKDLKVFVSRVIAKNSNNRRAKLDDNTSTGIFLHHTDSTSISKYLDVNTNREKTTSHLEYDEAHYNVLSVPNHSSTVDMARKTKLNMQYIQNQQLLIRNKLQHSCFSKAVRSSKNARRSH